MKRHVQKLAKAMVTLLALQVVGILHVAEPAHALSACSTSGVTAGNLEIKPVMDTKFYIDSATKFTPRIDAAYAGFTVKNTAITTKQGLWVSYDNFTGNSLTLADSRDNYIPLDSIGSGNTTPTYVLFKATTITTTDQTFDFKIWSGKPDVAGSTVINSCTYTYTAVVDSIDANANKLLNTGWNPSGSINSSAVQISNTSPKVGEHVTIWVQGNTGNLGSGATLNLTPATTSQWPTRVLRLQNVSISISRSTFPNTVSNFTENLAIPNADDLVQNSGGDYRATYVFQVIGTNSGNVAVRPMQHISSGTQYKHSDAASSTINVTLNSTISATMTKSSSTSSSSDTDPNYWLVPYTITLSTNSNSEITVDEIVDSPDSGMLFKASSATLTDVNNLSAVSIPNPGQISGDGKLHFSGPFVMVNGTPIVVNYSMKVPKVLSGTVNYTNSAIAKIGDTSLSSGNNAIITAVTVSGTAAITPVQNPELLTTAATHVDSTTATINGTIDIKDNSNSLNLIYFKYSSIDATLTTSDTATATPSSISSYGGTVVSFALNGLIPGTKYYFQVIGVKNLTTFESPNILNFTTIGITTVTADLSQGTVGSSYSEYIFAIGGSGTYTNWAITSGSLPTGTTLNASTGAITGTPTSAGTYTFTAKVTDSVGATHEKILEIVVANGTTTVTFNPNGGTLASGNATDTATVSIGADGLASKPATNPIRVGYSFSGWSLTSTGSVITTHTITGSQIYYAVWAANSAPAPVYVPKPPTITSISAPEVCAISSQLVIKGTWLSGATAKVDGVSAQVLSSSSSEMTIKLPSAAVGTKTITVSNADGSATTTVKYAFADTPIYVDYVYPETFKDRFFSYVFKALDAVKYEISGTMPAGLTLNSTTGELSGTPTQTGDFVFKIIASNICAETPLIVYMFVDKAIPAAFTCSVAFNVPTSNNITDQKLANLKNCLSKTSTLSPKYVQPIIFISGGIPAGLSPDEALTHPRYLPILALIESMNLNEQLYLGAFDGNINSVQLNVYWPEPTE